MLLVSVLDSTEPASTRWNDYLGTVAADDSVVLAGSKSLYELTGMDRDHWIIVRLDIQVTAATPEIVVFAAARSGGQARVEDLVDADGALPVMAYSIADPDRVRAVLDQGFGSLAIRLRPRSLSYPLRVVERGVAHDDEDH